MNALLIVNVGHAPASQLQRFGDFEQWAKTAIGPLEIRIQFHDGVAHPIPDQPFAGVIIMGSLSMVTEQAPWMQRLSQQIVELHDKQVPLLGICFGHQLIACALGGRADFNPQGLEIGTVDIQRHPESNDDPLFSTLPTRFKAQAVHFQSVLALPDGATCLASSEMDDHHAFRVGDTTWGVQFHPEFTTDIILDSLQNQKQYVAETYQNLVAQVCATPNAQQVLIHFAQRCVATRN
ncbi:glutamine amidotransferase [Vibrio sp. AK197]